MNFSPANKPVGDQIYSIIAHFGGSPEKVAKKLWMSVGTVKRWQSTKCVPYGVLCRWQRETGQPVAHEQNPEAGFGLVEVMITLGIMSVIMLGLMQVIVQAQLVSATADQKNNVTSIAGSTTGVALNNFTCTQAITKVANQYGSPLQFGDLVAGYSVPNYNLTVTGVTYDAPTLVATGYEGSKVYYGNLSLALKSNRVVLGGPGYAPRPIAMIYTLVDPSGKIIQCGSAQPNLPVQPAPPPPTDPVVKNFDFDADPLTCENFPVKARCPANTTVVVTSASYGANCGGVDSNYGQSVVQSLCAGQQNCDFTAGNVNNCTGQGVFVDPAVDCPKSFHMEYHCQ